MSIAKLFKILKDRLLKRDSVLENCWNMRDVLFPSENIESIFSLGSENLRKRFLVAFANEFEAFKRANTEKVAIKKKVIDKFEDGLVNLVNDFEKKPDTKMIDNVYKLFSVFKHNTIRFPIWERAYISPYKKKVKFVSVWANDDEDLIVSHGLRREYFVNFDLLVRFEKNKKWVINEYLDKLSELEKKIGYIGNICFINKYAGAKGTIILLEDFIRGIKDKNIICYSQITNEISMLNKGVESKDNRVCIFIDVVITGDSLKETKQILKKYGWNTDSCVIFGDYSKDCRFTQLKNTEVIVKDKKFMPEYIKENRGEFHSLFPIYSENEMSGKIEKPISITKIPDKAKKRLSEMWSDIEWWEKNKRELSARYKDKCIGITNKKILSAENEEILLKIAKTKNLTLSYVTYIEKEPSRYVYLTKG